MTGPKLVSAFTSVAKHTRSRCGSTPTPKPRSSSTCNIWMKTANILKWHTTSFFMIQRRWNNVNKQKHRVLIYVYFYGEHCLYFLMTRWMMFRTRVLKQQVRPGFVCMHLVCVVSPRDFHHAYVWACLCLTDVQKMVVRMSRNIRVGINKKRNQVSKTNWVYNNCFTFE